tara:strand:- start:5553 stop:6449 length:897 start_codon:yes stop_codon:yes gene_type:complete
MTKRAYSTIVKGKTRATTTVIASTPTPDRYDDVVAGGDQWLLEKYMANPVVQFGHDYNTPPVGKTERLTTDDSGNLVATIRWDDAPTNPLGQTVAAQFRDGFLSAVSVGFQPGRTTPRNKLPTDHPAYGEKGMLFEQNQLLEISAVPVPANGEALALRGMGADTFKHIISVEETDDTYVVTYTKYDAAPADDDEEEIEEEAYGEEEEEDKEHEPGHDEEEEEEEEEADMGDEEEDDEEKSFSPGARAVLRTMVRDTIIELMGHDEVVRSALMPRSNTPTKRSRRKAADPVAVMFGLDK